MAENAIAAPHDLTRWSVPDNLSACMASRTTSIGEPNGRDQPDGRGSIVGEAPISENELVEIIRALARAAARDDHRKAIEANAVAATEAGRG